MKISNAFGLTFVVFCCFLVSCASESRDKQVAVDAKGVSAIRIHNNNGSISIIAKPDQPEIIIGGYINFRLQKEESETLEIFDYRISGDTLTIVGVGSGKGFESLKLSLTVPENLVLIADQNNGNIIIDGVFGETNINLNSGRVSGKIWNRQLDMAVANGSVDIKIPGFDRDGYYLIRVGNGALKVYLPETAEGADIRAWSENGPLESDFGISAIPTVGEFAVGNGPVELRLLKD